MQLQAPPSGKTTRLAQNTLIGFNWQKSPISHKKEKLICQELVKKPIEIPSGVEVKIEGNVITAKGPKGTESITFREEVKVSVADKSALL